MLGALGLDSGTETVYRLMLEHPSWGVDRLAQALDQDRSAVTRALDTLADLALLRTAGTDGPRPGTPLLVPPRAGLGALLQRRQNELARTQLEIDASRSAVDDLLADYTAHGRTAAAGVERFTGAEAVHRIQSDLSAQARGEVLAIAPTAVSGGGPWDLDVPTHIDLLARGVRVRVLHLASVERSPQRRTAVRRLAQAGAEIRALPSLPLQLRIVDGARAVLPLAPDDPDTGVVLLTESGALMGLRAVFTYLWDMAAEAEDADDTPVPCSPQERALLRFLAEGLTDEAAARRLGISLRSERRMISGLTERFNVSSRFQLGLQAAQQGLL
ncbi:helix-turn-helix transcriptional regulator [Streptomyces sp. NBC_01565]|uniref:helix-turn-helix transcriptional regulator n=1 Tax=unclassified Streptomyces TaxID=2593676 RepID=UPI00224D87D6|nr:helix-turn-helix transcriptional regulator [Streptomyces sp. NBC_01565]MCX4539303.1 helix-turn-helix transcriptional regulator [Streptomyces sp. NBC_01565]